MGVVSSQERHLVKGDAHVPEESIRDVAVWHPAFFFDKVLFRGIWSRTFLQEVQGEYFYKCIAFVRTMRYTVCMKGGCYYAKDSKLICKNRAGGKGKG